MRRGLLKTLGGMGLPARRFVYEELEIRTGIGLTQLAAWALKRIRR
jgi:hypothetical protein